jgi:hypothetical protein
MFLQCFQIAHSLGALEDTKGVRDTRDRDIFNIIRGQLQE